MNRSKAPVWAEQADARDLKSRVRQLTYRFDSVTGTNMRPI